MTIRSQYDDPWAHITLQLSETEQDALVPQQPSDAPPPPPSDDSGGRFIGVPDTMRRIVGYDEQGNPIIEERPFATVRDVEGPAPFDPRLQGRTDILPGGAATTTQRRPVPPRYLDGDEKQPSKFGIGSVEARARIQLAMEQAGLLDPSKYRPGEWDEATWKAYRDVLEHANVNGYDWQESLTQLVENPIAQPDKKDGRGYLAPDYATLAQSAKQAVRQNLGREPEDWEVKLLADELGGGYQEQLTQQQQMDRYERDIARGEAEPGETFRQVDPKARFAERFEELYGPEIEAEQREEDAQTNTQLLMRSITGMDRTVGS